METVITVAAAAVSVVSLYFVGRQVAIMREQTELQREIAESAAQPYVWADLRPDKNWLFALVVGNSGPSVATNVRVTVEPPFPDSGPQFPQQTMLRNLAQGIASLAPGRQLAWDIGPLLGLIEDQQAYRLTIDYGGPFGEVDPVQYDVRMSDFLETRFRPPGDT